MGVGINGKVYAQHTGDHEINHHQKVNMKEHLTQKNASRLWEDDEFGF